MATLLDWWENINKDKHTKNFHDQRKDFPPFVLYVDGMLGREALIALVKLSQIMSAKMNKTVLHVRGWINGQIAIDVARFYSRMIR